MAPRPPRIITASDISWYLRSEFALWCRYNADASLRDPADRVVEARILQGIAHEERVFEAEFPGADEVDFETFPEGFAHVLKSMEEGVYELHAPPIWLPELGFLGIPDLLRRDDSVPSKFGDYSYYVSDVKSARRLQEHHILPTAYYAMLVNLVQESDQDRFTLLNWDVEEYEESLSEWQDELLEVIEEARECIDGPRPAPIFGVTPHPWSNYADSLAIESGDLTLIAGVKGQLSRNLRDAGFSSISDVASAPLSDLLHVPKIGGATGPKIKTKAQALLENRPVPRRSKRSPALPLVKRELFLDLEGLDSRVFATDDPPVYLIGLIERVGNKSEYVPFLAKSIEGEQEIWESFLEFVERDSASLAIYHYSHYERTNLRKLAQRHRTDKKLVEIVESALVDLQPVAVADYAFPTHSDTLKAIAKYLDFNWRLPQDEASALLAADLIGKWWNDGAGSQELIQPVLTYNEDDCLATVVVRDWLADHDPGAA